jgi:hypothetical protein
MEHAQEAIEEFPTRPARIKDIECDEDITFLLVGKSFT